MSKKLFTLIQTLCVIATLGTFATAHAGGLSAQERQEQWKQQFEQRHIAAQQRMAEWNKQAEQRHKAALEQQERWKQHFEERHAAALRGYDYWKSTR